MKNSGIKNKLRTLLFHLLPKPRVKDSADTLDHILANKCSVSRYGDGEFNLILKLREIHFQNTNKQLETRLKEILKSNQANHIVCLPHTLVDLSNLEPQIANFFWNNYWTYNYRKLIKHIDLSKTYFDAQITRPYIDFEDKGKCPGLFAKIKNIFEGQHIYIVEGDMTRTGVGNDLFDGAKSVKRIICPSNNAFDIYDEILALVVDRVPKDGLVLLCLGPTATVLAYDLAKLGYWAIDTGHIDMEYEWFLMNVTSRTAIKNKIVRETGEMMNLVTEDPTSYLESIMYNFNKKK